jgi:predicted RNase H-like HicB family nuclease
MKVVRDMQDGQEPEPTWEEAHAAFEAAEPAELVRPARKLRVVYQLVGGSWTATSPDLEGFEVTGASLAEAKARTAEALGAFLDPAVELNEKELVEVEAVVATDHPLPTYGGVRVDESVLYDLAEAIRSGSLPMLVGHDIRRPLNPTILDAQVRGRSDGYKDVWIRFTVDANAWTEFEEELAASGAPGGFSFAFSEPIANLPVLTGDSVASVAIEADASHWSDADLLAAAEDLRAVGSVHVGRRYQFAFEPLAVVVLTLVLVPILTGLVTNALYDGLKRFLRQGRRTIFQFRVEREDGSSVDARLETDDREVLRHAIEAFDRLVNPEQLNEWNERERTWKQLQQWSEAGQSPQTEPPTDRSAADVGVPAWIEELGITDRLTGQERARASLDALILTGRKVLGPSLDYRVEHLVFSGFLARAQGFHEGVVAAVRADNPYAAFTVLRAYAENAATILYVKDHPATLERFWRDTRRPDVPTDEIITYAATRFPGFKDIYSELSKYVHPHALSLLASSRVIEGRIIQWSSVPTFKSDHDAVIACVWVVELAEATSRLLEEFATKFELLGESGAF